MNKFTRTIVYMLASLMLFASILCALGGAASGFGDTRIIAKAAWFAAGAAGIVLSIYVLYVASGKSWKRLTNDLAWLFFYI